MLCHSGRQRREDRGGRRQAVTSPRTYLKRLFLFNVPHNRGFSPSRFGLGIPAHTMAAFRLHSMGRNLGEAMVRHKVEREPDSGSADTVPGTVSGTLSGTLSGTPGPAMLQFAGPGASVNRGSNQIG